MNFNYIGYIIFAVIILGGFVSLRIFAYKIYKESKEFKNKIKNDNLYKLDN